MAFRIGVLALQGDFNAHLQAFQNAGADACLIKKASELLSIDALALPGGESTAMLKLMEPELKQTLRQRISRGLPTFATCAGVILLAHHVSNPDQESLDLIDIDVLRNAYGRQVDSFVEPALEWSSVGREYLLNLPDGSGLESGFQDVEGVFIRAPRITRVGPKVAVLLNRGSDPVMVRSGNIWAITFHPELSQQLTVQKLFLSAALLPPRMN